MRIAVVTLGSLLLLAGLSLAIDESNCPAHKAAEAGFTPFEEFHHAIAPAWHMAWPKKDYDALYAAAPKFEEALVRIKEMKPTIKNEKRAAAFEEHRNNLIKQVELYSKAVAEKNEEAVIEILPVLHDEFEFTAGALMPITYKELDGLVVTSNVIVKQHLPNENKEGIVGSTETLVAKVDGLTAESIPPQLEDEKETLLAEFAELKKLAAELKKCCENDDMETYRDEAEKFNTKLTKLVETYL